MPRLALRHRAPGPYRALTVLKLASCLRARWHSRGVAKVRPDDRDVPGESVKVFGTDADETLAEARRGQLAVPDAASQRIDADAAASGCLLERQPLGGVRIPCRCWMERHEQVSSRRVLAGTAVARAVALRLEGTRMRMSPDVDAPVACV